MTAERCADACARRGDPVSASAPPVHRWVLVEQPGPWGRDALLESRLPREVALSVAAQAREAGARVLLVRRPGRDVEVPRRRWALVDSAPGAELVRWSEFTDPAELTDLGLDRPRGTPSADPVYLVCAHGRHDTCCALRGRPVAAAFAALRPAQTWECSHVGGDRFAGNVVVLPHGLYYGRITPAEVPRLVRAHEAGLVVPEHLRGRSSVPAAAQAAQHFARERLGERAVDALAPLEVHRTGSEQWRVVLDGVGGAPVRVTVRAVFEHSDTPLTCSATTNAAIRSFELVGLG
ncbi:sucrase ferredoxin [Umezawaea beigongshangensis]|uniref:sucrase ferredoxin n=1 Tax=Umezawaea beigongshangensis TaxID=2780383 RepID=UPI0018F1EED3|nr:sucrase ferredoxin [Umezawaea beigongshangensis]